LILPIAPASIKAKDLLKCNLMGRNPAPWYLNDYDVTASSKRYRTRFHSGYDRLYAIPQHLLHPQYFSVIVDVS
jgi:hypothetical protein